MASGALSPAYDGRSPSRSLSRGRSRPRSFSPKSGRSRSNSPLQQRYSRSPSPYGSGSVSPPGRGSQHRHGSPSPGRNFDRHNRTVGRSRSPTPVRNTKIVVERLTKNVNEDHLYEIFGQFGQIRDLDLPISRLSGTNRGTAYILFVDELDAEAAIAHMHEAQLDGATINVSIVLPRQKFSPPPPSAARRGGSFNPRNAPHAAPRGGRGRPRSPGRFSSSSRAFDTYRPPSLSRSRSRSPDDGHRRYRSRSPRSSRSRSPTPPPRNRHGGWNRRQGGQGQGRGGFGGRGRNGGGGASFRGSRTDDGGDYGGAADGRRGYERETTQRGRGRDGPGQRNWSISRSRSRS